MVTIDTFSCDSHRGRDGVVTLFHDGRESFSTDSFYLVCLETRMLQDVAQQVQSRLFVIAESFDTDLYSILVGF